jgi:hypothetical protein
MSEESKDRRPGNRPGAEANAGRLAREWAEKYRMTPESLKKAVDGAGPKAVDGTAPAAPEAGGNSGNQ